MKAHIKGITIIGIAACLSTAVYASHNRNHTAAPDISWEQVPADSTADQAFFKTSSSIIMKQLLAANLAAEKGNQTKALGKMMIGRLNTTNEQIRALAKSRNITLLTAVPDGGMRPDGRIDSAPENMKDTIRVKTGGGEAGNNGQLSSARVNGIRINDSVDQLRTLSGAAFDQAYVAMIRQDQQILLPLLEGAAKSSHTATRKFAGQYLTLLKKSPSQFMRTKSGVSSHTVIPVKVVSIEAKAKLFSYQ